MHHENAEDKALLHLDHKLVFIYLKIGSSD